MRSFLVCLLVVVGLCFSSQAFAAKPNVLFIAVDDLNDWIGVLGGHPQAKTPHLDRLAQRGLTFKRAYCVAPACNPSRTALLTGIRPSTSGIYVNPQPWRPVMKDVVTLPQHFMNHGYRVVGGGKIFHGRFKDPKSWHHYQPSPATPRPAPAVARSPQSRSGGIVWGVLDVKDEAMGDYQVVSWASSELKRKHDKPFFLACGIYRPHMPWQVPRNYYEMYPTNNLILPKVPSDDLEDLPQAGRRMARPDGDHATMMRTGNWRLAVQAYLASVSFADAQVGRLLDALDASPHRDNTIVVLWGDHGWHLGEKQHWRKFALWEEATRTPLFFVVPGVTKPGVVCEHPVDLLNIYPTLADLCGLPVGSHLEGTSLEPLLKDPDREWPRPALTTHGRNNHALRTMRWRYIRYADGSEELYDHEADPNEWNNVAADPQHKDLKTRLARSFPKRNVPEAPRSKRRTN